MPTWNLSHIHAPEEGKRLLAQLQQMASAFAQARSTLTPDISTEAFNDLIERRIAIMALESRISAYAELWLTENTADPERTSYATTMSEACAEADNQLIFFSLWFKDLDEKNAQRLIDGSTHTYYLHRVRAQKPHTLKEKEEQVINLKNLTGTEAHTRLYDIITNRFSYTFEGEPLNQEQINQYKHSPVRERRVAAYELVLSKYGSEEDVLGEIYRLIANDWKNEHLKLRNFKTPIAVRNLANDVPDSAVEALLGAVRKNRHLFQEYFALKGKALGLPKMDRYDLYAPYSSEEKSYPYEESKKIVLETYRSFDEHAFTWAQKIFDDGHVHSEISQGKRSGAFCYSITPELSPYIMLNHVGKLNDVFTMAHEFGHGIHSLAAAQQGFLGFHATLPLAETASIFGEMLLTERLLKEASAPERIGLLMRMLDGQYGSIGRQAYFVLFEKAAHEAVASGKTVKELNELYMENLKEQFGPLPVPDVFQHEWKYIPHIHHTPFYCYAYAFGNLLVLALYKRYREEGKAFVAKYLRILSQGGSAAPADILNEVGIDINSSAFWESGFAIIREEIEQLRGLL